MDFEFLQNLFIAFWPFWVGLMVVVAIILLARMYGGSTRLPYVARPALVTKSELRFYKSLQKAVQDDFEIFGMVRIADLLRVEPDAQNKRKWLNKILAKHIDFVLCDPGSLQPRVCIELDDPSHNRPDRIERDIFVNQAFDSAGLPLLRIPTQPSYRAREIRELIEDVL
jgi:very-short-patch-repair endonuclease